MSKTWKNRFVFVLLALGFSIMVSVAAVHNPQTRSELLDLCRSLVPF